MAQRHVHHNRVVTRFVKIPEPLEDGKIRCPGCSRVLTPTKHGKVRRHTDLYGDPCPVTGCSGQQVSLTEIPPVVLPKRPKRSANIRRPDGTPSRLDAGSECKHCGKWLPGERSVCGACSVARGRR